MSSVMRYGPVVLIVCLATGCATGGARYEDLMRTLETPPVNRARLIIYRESSIFGAIRSPTILINGRPTCDLPNASFFFVDVNPGEAHIATTVWDQPGVSSAMFVTKPEEILYIRFGWESYRIIGGVVGGLVGYLAAAEFSPIKGPFVFEAVEKAAALESLKPLSRTGCP